MTEKEIDRKIYVMEGLYVHKKNLGAARARLDKKVYEPDFYAVAVNDDMFNSRFLMKSESIDELISSLLSFSKDMIMIGVAPGLDEDNYDSKGMGEIYSPLAVETDREDIKKFKEIGIDYTFQELEEKYG
ncbi:hypothetical protein GF361_01805 [Candidatus Woesearchaeota archaeon]|nr:hypothetical protein [Candidatus Woesearchaeota archaeon]